MNLNQRSYTKELLDSDDIPFEDIKRNMEEIKTINKWLGGFAITLAGLQQLLDNNARVTICEIGCGSGDNLEAIYNWCIQKKISVHFIGIDLKKECIEAARLNTQLSACTEWVAGDYRNTLFKKKPSIIFSSLFCHHFTDEEMILQLQWLKGNCSIGFFINDLERHWLAYQSIKLLTLFFSSSYLVKNDAPLSVARGFTKNEWAALLNKAGIQNAVIQWKWAFRYLIIWQHEQRSI